MTPNESRAHSVKVVATKVATDPPARAGVTIVDQEAHESER